MLLTVLKALPERMRSRYYRIDYYLSALYEYIRHLLQGGNISNRLHRYFGSSSAIAAVCDPARLALFVAFHPGREVPQSNLNYLDALQKCGFRIVYIHNGPLEIDVVDSLSAYCERVFCRQNIGQDFGAWKDGYLYLRQDGLLDNIEWLLMCNDSNFFLGGINGERFVADFSDELRRKQVDLIALSKNYELWQHYQSFFLCYGRRIFASDKFADFWHRYKPLSHRYHAINNGEIALTRDVLADARPWILYRSSDVMECVARIIEDPAFFYCCLPQSAMYLAPRGMKCRSIDILQLQRITALLDYHNPSRVYALLFVAYLQSPFLKKDLFRSGVFALSQINSVLSSLGIDGDSDTLLREILCHHESGGSNIGYINYPKSAFRQGISCVANVYTGHGEALEGLGVSRLKS
jgi:hypothetical protein